MKKTTWTVLVLFALLGGVMSGCGGAANGRTAADSTVARSSILEVDSLLQTADALVGKELSVEGVCTHICQHGGGKIFLMGSDDTQTIRIDASEKVGKFSSEAVNSVVRVRGTLVEQRIDESYLDQWAEQLKAQEHQDAAGAACDNDRKARGEMPANSTAERIANFRERIQQRYKSEGKRYLSFYSITADEYEVL